MTRIRNKVEKRIRLDLTLRRRGRLRSTSIFRKQPRYFPAGCSWDMQLRRLLLRHAVDRAQAPDEVSAMDADNLTIRKQVSENIQRMAIVWIIEGRHQHQSIRDVKVGVAGGQPLSAKNN